MPELQESEVGQGEIVLDALPSLPLSRRSDLPRCSAVYFVRDGSGQVLYVGSASNLKRRWINHGQVRYITEQCVIAWAELPHDQVRITESIMVQRYNPPLNIQRPCADIAAGMDRNETLTDVVTCKCRHCKYEWVPRTTKTPRQCPKCWKTDWQVKGKSK